MTLVCARAAQTACSQCHCAPTLRSVAGPGGLDGRDCSHAPGTLSAGCGRGGQGRGKGPESCVTAHQPESRSVTVTVTVSVTVVYIAGRAGARPGTGSRPGSSRRWLGHEPSESAILGHEPSESAIARTRAIRVSEWAMTRTRAIRLGDASDSDMSHPSRR